jgi:hypothetical protein
MLQFCIVALFIIGNKLKDFRMKPVGMFTLFPKLQIQTTRMCSIPETCHAYCVWTNQYDVIKFCIQAVESILKYGFQNRPHYTVDLCSGDVLSCDIRTAFYILFRRNLETIISARNSVLGGISGPPYSKGAKIREPGSGSLNYETVKYGQESCEIPTRE